MSLRVDPSSIGDHLAGRHFAYVLTVNDGRVHAVAHRVAVEGASVTVGTASETLVRRVATDSGVTLLWPPTAHTQGEHADYSLIADGDGSASDEGRLVVEVTRATLHRPAP